MLKVGKWMTVNICMSSHFLSLFLWNFVTADKEQRSEKS